MIFLRVVLKNKATSFMKMAEALIKSKTNKIICIRDGRIATESGNVNLHPTKCTH